jgi:hypothetical protein
LIYLFGGLSSEIHVWSECTVGSCVYSLLMEVGLGSAQHIFLPVGILVTKNFLRSLGKELVKPQESLV